MVKTLPVAQDSPALKDQDHPSRKALQTELPNIRRVEYRDPETGKVYVFLTNHRRWAAQTVADLYKSGWDVELFFKWIKQDLKVCSFQGRSMNAVALQICVALCVYLLVAYRKFVSRTAMGIQAVLCLVQLNVFQRRPQTDLLRGRKQEPPDPQCICG